MTIKEEALKLADEILLCTTDPLHSKTSAMIRRLVEELDYLKNQISFYELKDLDNQTKPLSKTELNSIWFSSHGDIEKFAREIEERHGIK